MIESIDQELDREIRPKTLGDYRDLCAGMGAGRAVAFFDAKIAAQGRDAVVLADESQMLILIGSML